MLVPEDVTLTVEPLRGNRVVPLSAVLQPLRTRLLHSANEWINVARTFPGEGENSTVIFLDNGSTGVDKEIITTGLT